MLLGFGDQGPFEGEPLNLDVAWGCFLARIALRDRGMDIPPTYPVTTEMWRLMNMCYSSVEEQDRCGTLSASLRRSLSL